MGDADKYQAILENPAGVAAIDFRFGTDDFRGAQELWRSIIDKHPADIAIIKNGSKMFELSDLAYAILLLESLVSLPDADNEVFERLGHLYRRRFMMKSSFHALERAHSLSESRRNKINLAHVAFDLSLLDRSEYLCTQVVSSPPRDIFQHLGIAMLGRIQLQRGRQAESLIRLDEATMRGTRKFTTEPPDFYLAGELFDRGERVAIESYLSDVLGWTTNRLLVASYLSDLRCGASPRFPRLIHERVLWVQETDLE